MKRRRHAERREVKRQREKTIIYKPGNLQKLAEAWTRGAFLAP